MQFSNFTYFVEIEKMERETDPTCTKHSEKIYISEADQKRCKIVGRLLGPKGLTLKRIQMETCTKMTILGRGSMWDKQKEEELRNSSDPVHQHLNDDLHVLIEAVSPHAAQKLAAGVAEIRKMLVPLVSQTPSFVLVTTIFFYTD